MTKHGIHKIEDIKKLGKADLHIHSNFSDGKNTIEEILGYAQNLTDLDIIAVTDHDTIEGARLASEIMKKGEYRFELIIGEEITAQEGHILGLYLDKKIEPGQTAHETIKKIHAQGGIAIASHPFEHSRFKSPHVLTMDGVGGAVLIKERYHLNGLEVVNATPSLDDENLEASVLNKAILGLAETGSSDAHICEAIGRGYTLFEGKTIAELKKAILRRQTQAMHTDWTLLALIKYLFFFIPYGWRILLYNILHRAPKQSKIELETKMNNISKTDVEHTAQLARLKLTDAETEKMTQEIGEILNYVAELNQTDTSKVSSVAQVSGLENAVRADEITNENDRENLLKNAPEVKDGAIKVKKVFE